MEGFVQYGSWIFVDPDEFLVDLIEEDIDLETLCELIRSDSTDLLNLGDGYLGYVDGEGSWQERQTEWEFDGKPCWGPMLIFAMGNDDLDMISCTEEDLENIESRVQFLEKTKAQEFEKTQNTEQS
jgi:hypothetical protein